MPTNRIVSVTITSSSAVLATAATGLGTALTTSMNAVLSSPPTGYQAGSINLPGQPNLIYDGALYVFAQAYQYTTLI